VLASKALGGLRRPTVGVERRSGLRATDHQLTVWLLVGQVSHPSQEPAGGTGDDEAREVEALGVQPLSERRVQLLAECDDLVGRELLAPDLEHEGLMAGRHLPVRPRRFDRGSGDQAQRVVELGASLTPELGDLVGQFAHACEGSGPFGRADGASSVQDVEAV